VSTSAPSSEVSQAIPFIDRDQAILAFNARVLDWARREEVPLLERLRYLCIVSSNMDEFFEVRFALHFRAALVNDEKGQFSVKSYQAISAAAHELVAAQYDVYNHQLTPAFAKAGIRILSHSERTLSQQRWVKRYFEQEVRPLLIPVGLDPAHPFPQVVNKSLNFIVELAGKDAFGKGTTIAVMKAPRVLPRIIRLPDGLNGNGVAYCLLSSVIHAHSSLA
jgi:polyphosphate kinase